MKAKDKQNARNEDAEKRNEKMAELEQVTAGLTTDSMKKLSTGCKINSSRDAESGYQVAN